MFTVRIMAREPLLNVNIPNDMNKCRIHFLHCVCSLYGKLSEPSVLCAASALVISELFIVMDVLKVVSSVLNSVL